MERNPEFTAIMDGNNWEETTRQADALLSLFEYTGGIVEDLKSTLEIKGQHPAIAEDSLGNKKTSYSFESRTPLTLGKLLATGGELHQITIVETRSADGGVEGIELQSKDIRAFRTDTGIRPLTVEFRDGDAYQIEMVEKNVQPLTLDQVELLEDSLRKSYIENHFR